MKGWRRTIRGGIAVGIVLGGGLALVLDGGEVGAVGNQLRLEGCESLHGTMVVPGWLRWMTVELDDGRVERWTNPDAPAYDDESHVVDVAFAEVSVGAHTFQVTDSNGSLVTTHPAVTVEVAACPPPVTTTVADTTTTAPAETTTTVADTTTTAPAETSTTVADTTTTAADTTTTEPAESTTTVADTTTTEPAESTTTVADTTTTAPAETTTTAATGPVDTASPMVAEAAALPRPAAATATAAGAGPGLHGSGLAGTLPATGSELLRRLAPVALILLAFGALLTWAGRRDPVPAPSAPDPTGRS